MTTQEVESSIEVEIFKKTELPFSFPTIHYFSNVSRNLEEYGIANTRYWKSVEFVRTSDYENTPDPSLFNSLAESNITKYDYELRDLELQLAHILLEDGTNHLNRFLYKAAAETSKVSLSVRERTPLTTNSQYSQGVFTVAELHKTDAGLEVVQYVPENALYEIQFASPIMLGQKLVDRLRDFQ